jgi:hypothetical protein
VDGLAVCEEHYAKMMALLWNVYPAANLIVSIHDAIDSVTSVIIDSLPLGDWNRV